MDAAQKARLRVLVNRATDTRGFEAVVAWVEQYAERPRQKDQNHLDDLTMLLSSMRKIYHP